MSKNKGKYRNRRRSTSRRKRKEKKENRPKLKEFNRKVKKWTSTARLDGVMAKGTFDHIYAGALVFNSTLLRLFWNMVQKVVRPKNDYLTFNSIEEAEEWCLQKRKEQMCLQD